MSFLLTVPNDDSGFLSVIPIALFISKAVRATGSLLLSFAGGDHLLKINAFVGNTDAPCRRARIAPGGSH